MTSSTDASSDSEALAARIREQESALADLLIERRADRNSITLLRLELGELTHELEKTRYALERRSEQLEDVRTQLKRSLGTARGARQALARLQATLRSPDRPAPSR
jgi:chromosome segregation ATPase